MWAKAEGFPLWPGRVISRANIPTNPTSSSGQPVIPVPAPSAEDRESALVLFFYDNNRIGTVRQRRMEIFFRETIRRVMQKSRRGIAEHLVVRLVGAVKIAVQFINVHNPPFNNFKGIPNFNYLSVNVRPAYLDLQYESSPPVGTIVWAVPPLTSGNDSESDSDSDSPPKSARTPLPMWPAHVVHRYTLPKLPQTTEIPEGHTLIVWFNRKGQYAIVNKKDVKIYDKDKVEEVIKQLSETTEDYLLEKVFIAVTMANTFISMKTTEVWHLS